MSYEPSTLTFVGFTNNDDCDDDGIDGVDETESVEDGDSDLADNVFTVEDEEGGVENIDDIPASSSLGMEEKMVCICNIYISIIVFVS